MIYKNIIYYSNSPLESFGFHLWLGEAISAAGSLLGSIIASDASSDAAETAAAASRDITRETNEINYKIAQETNATNTANTKANNDLQLQLQREMNNFNLAQWNRNNAYNSPSAQKARLLAAGINPNMMFGGYQSSSSSPVQQVSIPQTSVPNLVTPTMESNANNELLAGLQKAKNIGDILNTALDVYQRSYDVEKTKADTEVQLTEGKFRSQILAKGLEYSDAQIKSLYGSLNKLESDIQVNQANIQNIQAQVLNTNEDTKGKAIENFFKSDYWSSTISKLKKEMDYTDVEINYIQQKLPIELGFLSAQTSKTYSDIQLNDARRSEIDASIGLITAQTQQARFNLTLDTYFGYSERSQGLENSEKIGKLLHEQWRGENWNNSPGMRAVNAAGTILGGVSHLSSFFKK
nr:pilot protein for DNA ejection [Microvirus sp.]